MSENLPLVSQRETAWFEIYWRDKIQPGYCRPLRWAVMAGTLSTLLLLVYSCRHIEDWVRAMPRFSIQPDCLVIKTLPAWARPFIKKVAPVALPASLNMFDATIAAQIAQSFLRNPWVREVKRVSKKFPNQISIQVILRRPVAFIFMNNRYYAVDEQGVRLSGGYPILPILPYFLPYIVGGDCPIPAPGRQWQDHHLLDALQVVRCLVDYKIFESLPVEFIRIAKTPARYKVIVLVTQDEKRIIWGRTLRCDLPVILPKRRIKALQSLYPVLLNSTEFEAVDEVDISFGYAILRES